MVVALLATGASAQKDEPDPMLTGIPGATENVRTFAQALALLRAQNSDLRIQAERVRQAQGDSWIALARILPSITGSALAQQNILAPGQNFIIGGGGVGTGTVPGQLEGGAAQATAQAVTPTHVLGLGVVSGSLALIDVPAWNGISAAHAAQRAAQRSLDDVQRTLVGALSRRLIAAVASERLADLQRVGLRNALERLEITRRSFELGASNRLDVVRLEQDSEVARGEVLQANEVLRKARDDLGLLLGRSAPVGVAPGFNLEGLAEQTRSVCQPLEDVRARADLQAQRELVDAASKRVNQATGAYLPTLSLQSQVYAFTVDPGPIAVPAWNIAAVLQFTFWDGGEREGTSARVRSQLREAEERAELAERTARIELAQARRSIEVARDRMRESRQARDLAAEGDRLTRRAYEIGRGTSLDLVQSGATLRQAELNLVLREFDLASAVVDAFVSLSACRLEK